jgi:hypothetical protein
MDVMAITAPIYNEPDCSSAACHVHPPGQRVLGTLDIGLSRAERDRSLAMLRFQMMIFTVMSLILTIGGVTALLRRNVFLPLQRLRNYIESSALKNDVPEPPPRLPHDLDTIAAGFYNLKIDTAGEKKDSHVSGNGSN